MAHFQLTIYGYLMSYALDNKWTQQYEYKASKV